MKPRIFHVVGMLRFAGVAMAGWLVLAGPGLASAAPAVSPITRQVVDAANLSINGGNGYIDPTRDNASGAISWGESYLLKAYNQMYRATGDRAYLNEFIEHAEWALSKRNDRTPINTAINPSQAHYKVNGQDVIYDRPLWAMSGHGYTSASVTSGHIVEGLARFARIVNSDPSLAAAVYDPGTGKTYGQKAAEYIADATLTMNTIDQLLLIYTPQGTAYKAYVAGSPFTPPGYTPMIDAANADGQASMTLFELYKATGNVDFLSRAQRTMRTVRGQGLFNTERGNLAWTYGYSQPLASDPEDVSHAAHVATAVSGLALDRLRSPGLYNSQDFTDAQGRAFVKTYLEEGYLGNGLSKSGIEGSDALEIRFNNPNMDPGEWAWGVAGGMIELAQFDLRLLPVAQAVQVEYYGLNNQPPSTSNNPVAWPVLGYANLFRYNSVPQQAHVSVEVTGGGATYRTQIPDYSTLDGPVELTLVNTANPSDVQHLTLSLGGHGDEWEERWQLSLTLNASQAPSLLNKNISLTLSLLDGFGKLKELTGGVLPSGFASQIRASGAQLVLNGTLAGTRTFLIDATEDGFALTLPGDVDLDGDVDLNDLSMLASHYGSGSEMLWLQGDFDLDRDVDLNDLSVLASNYGAGEAQAFADFQMVMNVPEAGILPLAAMWIGLWVRRRR